LHNTQTHIARTSHIALSHLTGPHTAPVPLEWLIRAVGAGFTVVVLENEKVLTSDRVALQTTFGDVFGITKGQNQLHSPAIGRQFSGRHLQNMRSQHSDATTCDVARAHASILHTCARAIHLY
jgi:hypothetical protein